MTREMIIHSSEKLQETQKIITKLVLRSINFFENKVQ